MRLLASLLVLTPLLCPVANSGEWSGHVAGEALFFPQDAIADAQHNEYISLVAQPQYHQQWNLGRQRFTFIPFVRWDQYDDERTHADIRELNFTTAGRDWALLVGIGKVFWGVLESVHLVDIINQTDEVENIDTEDKLGQPMINLSWIRDWGTLDFFVLPGFRERTFPDREGRPRLEIPIDNNNSIFESGDKEKHVDFALRWSRSIGDWDIGIAHFTGTSREPAFVPVFDATGMPVKLIPRYDLIDQTSIDLQATKGSWLWKLEAYTRSGQGDRFSAAAGGFEYTFVGMVRTALDLGVLMEYLYDERSAIDTLFQNDLFSGIRLTFNNPQSTEVLAGIITDLDNYSGAYNIEASRRLGQSWKLSTQVRGVYHTGPEDPQNSFRNDHSVRLELARHF